MLIVLPLVPLAPVFADVAPASVSPPPAHVASQYPTPGQQAEVVQQQEVRPLPGQLDTIPVFNSNSPELVQQPGILLSTFSPSRMANPEAHLNYTFEGRFDLFFHHVARGLTPDDRRTLYIGVLVHNPTSEPVTLDVLQGVTYLSQEAPFLNLPTYVANPHGEVFAGPGSRTTTDILQGEQQPQWPAQVRLAPGATYLLMNVPIPLRQLTVPVDGTWPPGATIPYPPLETPVLSDNTNGALIAGSAPIASNQALPSNGRSTLMYLNSSGPVSVASLAMYAPLAANGKDERVPSLDDWTRLLTTGRLSGPRDLPPTDPTQYRRGRFYYGRVAGVSQGSTWNAIATDTPDSPSLTIPTEGQSFSYVISTVDRNTFGTRQIQSAPMLVRYPDTAFRAHGNYGVHYAVTLPLYNPTDTLQTVVLKLQTPVQDESLKTGLRFRLPPDDRIFFRGTVRLRYMTNLGIEQTRYIHVVQRRGQAGEPLLQVTLPPQTQRTVQVDFIYPPDATPPQVLTVKTLGDPAVIQVNQPDASPSQTASDLLGTAQ